MVDISDCVEVQVNLPGLAQPGSRTVPGNVLFYQNRMYECHAGALGGMKDYGDLDSEELKECLIKVKLETDARDQEDKPWRFYRSDYFNYELDERSFKGFIQNQIKMRFAKRGRSTLGSTTVQNKSDAREYLSATRNMPYRWNQHGGSRIGPPNSFAQTGGYGPDRTRRSPSPNGPIGPPGQNEKGQMRRDNQGSQDSLYIIGFPRDWGRDKLADHFSQYGGIQSTHVIMQKSAGQRAAGIVTFNLPEDAAAALSRLRGVILDGQPLEARWKAPPKNRDGGKGMGGKMDHSLMTQSRMY